MGQISATSSPASSATGATAMAGSLLSGDGTMLGAGDPLTSPFSGLLGSLMADLGSAASQTGATATGATGADASQTATDTQQGVLAQFLTGASKTAASGLVPSQMPPNSAAPDAGQSQPGTSDATMIAADSDGTATGGMTALLPTPGLFPPMPAALNTGAQTGIGGTGAGQTGVNQNGGSQPLPATSGAGSTDAAQQAALAPAPPSQGQATASATTGTPAIGDTAPASDSGKTTSSSGAPNGAAVDLAQQAAAQAALAAMMPLPQPPAGTVTFVPGQTTGAADITGSLGGGVLPGQMAGQIGGQTMGSAAAPATSGASAAQPTTAGQTASGGSGFALPAGLTTPEDTPPAADATALNALAAAAVKSQAASGSTASGTATGATAAAAPLPAKGPMSGDGATPQTGVPPQTGAATVAANGGKPSMPVPGPQQSATPATPSLSAAQTAAASSTAAVQVGGIGAAATANKVVVGGIGASTGTQGATGTGTVLSSNASTISATPAADALGGQSATDQSGGGTQNGGNGTGQGTQDSQTTDLLDALAGRSTHGAANADAARFLMPGQTAEAAQAAGGAAQSLLSSQQTAGGVDLSKSYLGTSYTATQGRMAQYPPTLMQVSMNLQKAVQSGADTVTVQLKPDDLGSINVRLSFEKDGRVKANISADNVKTLDMLQRNSGDLQKSLQSAGIKADSDSLSFSLQDDGQSGQQQQQARPQKTTTALFNMDDQNPEITPVPETTIAANGRVDVRI